ncbi:CHASE2 domain-containing protein [Bdellovibrio sp. HCB337]|uniref:CHASE2 domain-containing protein n=1 Tax=Bdellovibrio sp. HCB337 TaxID=3394358 RepID=UPI0039A6241A
MKTERISLLIGFIITLGIFAFSLSYYKYKATPAIQRGENQFMDIVEVLDLRFNDLKYKLKKPSNSQAPVALIALDDASLREIGRWPWSRELVSEMTEKLIDNGVSSVGFDVIFSEPEKGLLEADAKFGQLIQKHPDKIILGTFSEKQHNYKPYQDLCVAEAFLKNGGDQIAKLNPKFAIDETGTVFDDLNWAPLFEVLFQNVQHEVQQGVLQGLKKNSVEELTEFQKNNLAARKSESLFEYCKTWLTPQDVFLDKEVVAGVTPLYLKVTASHKELGSLSFEELVEKIKTAYTNHPIPQYGEWTPNVPVMQMPASYSASFVAMQDADGYVRRYPLYFRSGNKLGSSFIPSLALQSYLLSGPYRAEVKMGTGLGGVKKLDEFTIYNMETEPEQKVASLPVGKSGELLINYYGRQMSLPYVSAKELFNDSPNVSVQLMERSAGGKQIEIRQTTVSKQEFFKNRSVLVGATAIGLYDLRSTPLEANYPGPELHLTMLANLLDQNFLKAWTKETSLMPYLLLVLGILITIAWAFVDSLTSFMILAGVMIVGLGVDIWLFLSRKLLVHTFMPYALILFCFFAIQLYRYFTEEKKKRELKSTFSKYVSPAVVDELLKDAENLKLGGRKEHMTVFFSDVRGFTTISEKLPPEELSRVLNLYLTPMTEIVFKNNGTLDKYIGDAIMAFFGAPIKHKNHAKEACRCALQNLEKLKDLQKEFEAQGLPHIDIGIGINTGAMSVGNMGSNIVQNYTVMGDSVNLAARLEGINKEYGTRIIISQFTHAEIGSDFTSREVDRVRVKGKYEPVRIFELVCEGEPSDQVSALMKHFHQGYELYHKKQFAEALEVFKKALTVSQNDPVSELYVERCQEYLSSAPPDDWDGVYVMKTK